MEPRELTIVRALRRAAEICEQEPKRHGDAICAATDEIDRRGPLRHEVFAVIQHFDPGFARTIPCDPVLKAAALRDVAAQYEAAYQASVTA